MIQWPNTPAVTRRKRPSRQKPSRPSDRKARPTEAAAPSRFARASDRSDRRRRVLRSRISGARVSRSSQHSCHQASLPEGAAVTQVGVAVGQALRVVAHFVLAQQTDRPGESHLHAEVHEQCIRASADSGSCRAPACDGCRANGRSSNTMAVLTRNSRSAANAEEEHRADDGAGQHSQEPQTFRRSERPLRPRPRRGSCTMTHAMRGQAGRQADGRGLERRVMKSPPNMSSARLPSSLARL